MTGIVATGGNPAKYGEDGEYAIMVGIWNMRYGNLNGEDVHETTCRGKRHKDD
jgi:hypothetical protein